MKTNRLKRDIFNTLKQEINESFKVIPKGSEIKKLLRESEMPFMFEVPFVLKDDLENIISEISNLGEQVSGKYMLSFKENTNTLEVRSVDQVTNDILISLINQAQIFGSVSTNQFPLGAQIPEEKTEETLADVVANTLANGAICPTCGESETKIMGESIRYCPFCTTLFETKEIAEDLLIEPKNPAQKAKIQGNDPEEKQPEDAEIKAVVEDGAEGTSGLSTANIQEIPTQFSRKQKQQMRMGDI